MVQGRRRRRHREQVLQKKKKKKRGCDRMKVEIMIGEEAKCAMVCATPLHPSVCVCSFNIIIFWGVFFFFLLSRSPSLRIKQPAFRVES